MIALHTTIAIVAIVLLIIRFKVDPIISLVIGSLYLGLASGVGFEATLTAITIGFGDIMAKIGLLIGFGVLIGSLLHAIGAFRAMVELLVRLVEASRLPYVLAVALATVFPSIYVDVQVVIAAPVARSSASFVGPRGLPFLAGALGTGIFCGYVFVIPGLAAVSIAGLLQVPLGTYLVYGLVVGPVTAVLTVWIFGRMLKLGWWKADRDEEEAEALVEEERAGLHVETEAEAAAGAGSSGASSTGTQVLVRRRPSLGIAVLPIVVPLVMIAFGAFAGLLEFSNSFIDFLGNPTFALFVGLLGAYGLARYSIGTPRTADALEKGLHTSGEILLVTGVGGSLGAVIEVTGLADVLGGLFSVNAAAPVIVSVLLAWFIAAVLHLAIGSVSVAAITAAGIIGPILGSLTVSPVVIALAIASGSLFALQVNSNFFWMFKALLGLSTSGSLKTLTTVTTIASVISIPLVVAVSLVAP